MALDTGKKILQGLFCTSQGSCTSCTQAYSVGSFFAGSQERAAPIRRNWFPLSSRRTSAAGNCTPLWHRHHDPGWKRWIHGMVRDPSLTARLPEKLPPHSLHTKHLTGLSSLPGSGCSLLGPHGDQEGAGGSEKPLFRLF